VTAPADHSDDSKRERVIRVFDEAGNVIKTHEQAVALMEWRARFVAAPVAW